jgi:Holliday junction resolvasome RuvABC ATP-dependent DNA helicase subunit
MKQYLTHIIAFQTITQSTISKDHLDELFSLLGVDEFGLNKSDRRVIAYLSKATKPVGETALATAAGVSKDDLLSIIEPKLEHLGFLTRTARGRELSEECRKKYTI